MKKRGFSLIELAIVLSIIGLIISGSLKAAKVMRDNAKVTEAKTNAIAAKNAVIGYAIGHGYLPTGQEFKDNLSPVKGNQKQMFYSVDSRLVDDDVCAYTSTNLSVFDSISLENYPNANPPKEVNKIRNIAFVVASSGVNYNMQTTTKIDTSPEVLVTPGYKVNVHAAFTPIDENTTPINRQSDEYDDVVEWVTLSQLKKSAQCQSSLKLITNFIPKLDINSSKIVPIFTDDDAAFPYTWNVKLFKDTNTSNGSHVYANCDNAKQLPELKNFYQTYNCKSFALDINFTDGETANRVDINVSDSYGNSDIRSYAVSLR